MQPRSQSATTPRPQRQTPGKPHLRTRLLIHRNIHGRPRGFCLAWASCPKLETTLTRIRWPEIFPMCIGHRPAGKECDEATGLDIRDGF